MIKMKMINVKNNIKYMIIGIVLGSCVSSYAVYIDDVKLLVSKVNYPIMLNGQKLDTIAINYEGSTFLSLRKIAEATKSDIKWNSELRQVEISNVVSEVVDKKPTGSVDIDQISFVEVNGKNLLVKNSQQYISVSDIGLKLGFYIQHNKDYTLLDILKDKDIIKSNIPIFLDKNRVYLSYELYISEILPLF